MKKILSSALMLSAVVAAVVVGTSAYFSDTETSTDNTFVAGEIDLEVANAGYYNGVLQDGSGETVDTSWALTDLTNQLFFNFLDVKPGDWGENTTTLYFESNPAYLCANITLTSAAENGLNDAEEEDLDGGALGNWDGELDDEIRFVAWVDDGDNSYEDGETVIMDGYASDLPQSDTNDGVTMPIADDTYNAYGTAGEALPSETDYYIAHAWCFGEMDLYGADPVADNDPTTDPGFTCDGSSVTNVSQSDNMIGNISFYAVQYRHNEDFVCADGWNPNW